eukprot:4111822-Pyramimonas_sp.AAC.1
MLVLPKVELSSNVQVVLDSEDVLVRCCTWRAAAVGMMWPNSRTNHAVGLAVQAAISLCGAMLR